MPSITLTHITKRWKNYFGVDDLSLDIPDNAFVTLLGPSGCGKTTILRMIAGLETPTEGQIKIGDRVVFDSDKGINVPANKRKVGFLFQNYALWPNMTVYQNISFGLKNIKEELPVIDVKAKVSSDLMHALKSGKKVKDQIEDCRDKNGKLDTEKAYVKLIDTFNLSIMSAKELFNLKIHEAADPQQAADAARAGYEKTLAEINAGYAAKGQTLDEHFHVTQNGTAIMEVRKLTDEEIDSRVRQVSRVVKIGMFMDRYPAELSGGQQQRVAIARTLAPEPQVLFMDEPLSNLDAKLRLEMRYELQRLHLETGSTFVYVTHDQLEAMTLATRICLIRNGVIQQYDPPLKVYSKPNNLFVADFVGNPAMNFVQATAEMKEGRVEVKGLTGSLKGIFTPNEEGFSLEEEEREYLRLKKEREALKEERASEKGYVEKKNADTTFVPEIMTADGEEVVEGGKFYLGIRPEAVRVCSGKGIEAEVYAALPSGMETTVRLKVNDFILTSVVFGGVDYPVGSKVNIDFESDNILLFDRRDGRLVASGKLEIE